MNSTLAARVRFAMFCLVILALPGGVMAFGDSRLVDLGKLALILSPAITGFALGARFGPRGARVRWRGVAEAVAITLTVSSLALAVSLIAGASVLVREPMAPASAGAAIGATALTSLLEELGWARGGLALAVDAFGRRVGVIALGLVWAAWHLIPAFLTVGLFPELEAAPPLMLAAFVFACLAYRELLTRFVERSNSWLAAAAGHVAPNVMLTGLVASGLVVLERPEAWPLFPAPGGLVFLALVLTAVLALRGFAGGSRVRD